MFKVLKKLVIYIVTAMVFLSGAIAFAYCMYRSENQSKTEYRARLIQEFCERSDYDFCEIDKIIYKERVEELP